MTSRVVLAAFLVAAAASVAADGIPSTIVVASDAPASDQLAARELASYLKLACPNQNFTIAAKAQSAAIVVGPGAATAMGLPASTLAGLGNEVSSHITRS